MRNRLTLSMAASVLSCTLAAAAEAQTIRGIHEPAKVTPIDPAAPRPAPETPAASQPDDDSTAVDALTVEARRLTRPQMEKRALRFVQAYAAPSAKLDQFARWNDPVCVQVTMSDAAEARRIEARIREVAKTIGAKVQRFGCNANVEVVFAEDPQHWLDWVARRRASILGFHYVSDTEALKTITRPIQAWYQTSTHSDGFQGSAALAFGLHLPGAGMPVSTRNETIDDPSNISPAGCADTRFTSCLQSVFSNVLVFVDEDRIKGQDLGAMTDYLAMLTLSQPRSLDGCAAFPSVIDLLAPDCPSHAQPTGLTPADVAYLKALYGANQEARRMSEESDIAARMIKNLIKAKD